MIGGTSEKTGDLLSDLELSQCFEGDCVSILLRDEGSNCQ
jgi:hypothetical protein